MKSERNSGGLRLCRPLIQRGAGQHFYQGYFKLAWAILINDEHRSQRKMTPRDGKRLRKVNTSGNCYGLHGSSALHALSHPGNSRSRSGADGVRVLRDGDGKSQGLEEQLPKIVAGFIRLALADRADKENRAAAERERQRLAEEHAKIVICTFRRSGHE
jgi:hypothetical protein